MKFDHIHFWHVIYVSRKGKKFRVTFACECGAGLIREIKFIKVKEYPEQSLLRRSVKGD